ncbi:MAG TPA: DUF1257 domain-containing protein [Caldisericia bacterium]|nr:DUF1257 domain-containing protein [Caldisericia bacterium]
MSHVSKIELEIQSLEDLKLACKRLGFIFQDNQQTYQWYGRSVGDSPLPEGFNVDDLGRCDHAIKVPECAYEIGVVKRGSKYILLWDSWHTGGLEKKIGQDAGILKQAYTVERIKKDAKRKNYTVREIKKDQSMRLVLRLS